MLNALTCLIRSIISAGCRNRPNALATRRRGGKYNTGLVDSEAHIARSPLSFRCSWCALSMISILNLSLKCWNIPFNIYPISARKCSFGCKTINNILYIFTGFQYRRCTSSRRPPQPSIDRMDPPASVINHILRSQYVD